MARKKRASTEEASDKVPIANNSTSNQELASTRADAELDDEGRRRNELVTIERGYELRAEDESARYELPMSVVIEMPDRSVRSPSEQTR